MQELKDLNVKLSDYNTYDMLLEANTTGLLYIDKRSEKWYCETDLGWTIESKVPMTSSQSLIVTIIVFNSSLMKL